LIELGGVRLLTDPLLRDRVAHLRRQHARPVVPADLDAILVSHAHHDHLDLPSLRLLDADVPIVAAPGAARALRRTGRPVRAVRPGEAVEVAGVAVRVTPAVHDGRRVPFGAATPAVGFLAGGVYFAGDTEVYAGMAELAVDVALLPIAGWGRRLGPGHMDPRQAAEALALLGPRIAVPIHWGTYRPIGARPHTAAPVRAFTAHAAELAPDVRVVVLEPGATLEISPAE
jgi:L-ascorbate metabolism protein UlaG (beta-lactamase superfamily)